MKSLGKQMLLLAAVLVVGAPCVSLAQDRASRAPAPGTPVRDVASPQTQEPAGLLLPAVQKAAESPAEPTSTQGAPRNVQTAPQRGIEPDEIDNASRATDRSRARQPTAVDQ